MVTTKGRKKMNTTIITTLIGLGLLYASSYLPEMAQYNKGGYRLATFIGLASYILLIVISYLIIAKAV